MTEPLSVNIGTETDKSQSIQNPILSTKMIDIFTPLMQSQEKIPDQGKGQKEMGTDLIRMNELHVDDLIERKLEINKESTKQTASEVRENVLETPNIVIVEEEKSEKTLSKERENAEEKSIIEKFEANGMSRVIFTGTYSAGELDTSESRRQEIGKTEELEKGSSFCFCFSRKKKNIIYDNNNSNNNNDNYDNDNNDNNNGRSCSIC